MPSQQTFRILALSGGGARGVFQTAYLKRLEEQLGTGASLCENIDLVVGTSTGSLVALSIAAGTRMAEIDKRYRQLGESVFKRNGWGKFKSLFRNGGRFNKKNLQTVANGVLGATRLGQCRTGVVVTATCLDDSTHRLFKHLPDASHLPAEDENLLAVDVALASCAAPTYFPPHRPDGQDRTYVDGGLWANNPCMVGVFVAHGILGIPYEQITLISVGTGVQPQDLYPKDFAVKTMLSARLIRSTIGLFSSAQARCAEDFMRTILGDRFHHADVQLTQAMPLDDYKQAVELLPGLAEGQATKDLPKLRRLLGRSHSNEIPKKSYRRMSAPIPADILDASGLSAIYPNREYYRLCRPDAASISKYISGAKRTLRMVSVNFMTGDGYEDIKKVFVQHLSNSSEFELCISLPDPRNSSLLSTLAPNLKLTPEGLATSIQNSLNALWDTRGELSKRAQERWYIGVHDALPCASAIIIDEKLPTGRIQIETKAYKQPVGKSFAFEFSAYSPDSTYHSLLQGYVDLIADGSRFLGRGAFEKNKGSVH